MNFNNPPNKGGMPLNRTFQNTQQQPQMPQNSIYLMLPPQFANLTPQQLQQLRGQPQFQALVKNYMQRQQLAQQQKVSLQGASRGSGTSVPFQSMAQNQYAPGFQAPLQQAVPPQSNLMMRGNMAPANSMMNTKINKGPPYGPQQGVEFHPNLPQGNPAQMLPQKAGIGQSAPNPVASDPVLSANNDIMSKLHLKELSSPHQWSEKLKSEAKEVSADLKAYEMLVENEMRFMKNNFRLSKDSKELMESRIKDIKSYSEIKQLRMNAINLSNKGHFNNSIWGEGYQGYGNGITNTATKLILPNRDRLHVTIPDTRLTEREMNERVAKRLAKSKSIDLVPIRLDFDQERDKFKLRDTFLWDVDEDVLTLEDFVASLIEDYKFIGASNAQTLLNTIKEQTRDYRKKPERTMGELRIPIKIDITINNTQLVDQFEWDILNFDENDPEEFATVMCDELNLPGEFTTAIAHSVREQAQLFHKALYLVGYSFDGAPVQEEEIRNHILPSLRVNEARKVEENDEFYSVLRNPNIVPDFTPTLVRLTQLELERLDKEIERESRRKRRHNLNEGSETPQTSGSGQSRGSSSRRNALYLGRGGSVLPDLSDIPKTFRTPAPSSILPGGIDLGVPDIYGYNEILVHRSQVPNPEFQETLSDSKSFRASGNHKVDYLYDSSSQEFRVTIRIPNLRSNDASLPH